MDSTVIVAIIGGVFGLAGTAAGILNTVFSKRNARELALENGVLCLLRAEIIKSHDKYMEQGEIPLYAKEALEREYNAYHELGGNGTMTHLYEECMRLPVRI